MSHRGAMNHFHQNRNFLRRVQRTKSLLITESAAIRIDLTLHECTTLPTRRKDHATHPTGQSWIRGTRVNRSQHGSIIEIFTPNLRVET